MGKVKIGEKEFDIPIADEALILAIQELTKQIKILGIKSNGR